MSWEVALNILKPTILCIHGNHEIRPWNIPTYKTKEWNGGTVWYEDEYPSLLFAKDGEIYDIEGIRHIAIGGAYSVDMFYRLARGYGWWADEQPSSEIMQYVEQQLKENKIDVVLSHTCPFKYEPVEVFLPGIDQSTVDTTTEKWLEKIEETTDYIAWYCGHWHINKRIDKMHFLFHKFESSEAIKDELERKINDASPEENYMTAYWYSHDYKDSREFAVWDRWDETKPVPEGYVLIFGHTPTCYFHNAYPWSIWKSDEAIGIDCGGGFEDGRLSCLRLDDMKEFYSEL